MKLHLVDNHPDVADALAGAFARWPEVEVCCRNIFDVAENCVVSPANSQGYMDGGLDRLLVEFFGLGIQTRVHEAIARRSEGFLPVGATVVVKTGHARIPHLLVAATMTAPEQVSADNAFRAFRAILRTLARHQELGRSIYCPGLCTGIGEVSPVESAQAMARAYEISSALA